MIVIALASITVPPGRHRTHFNSGKIKDLAHSIAGYGLLHPIVVQELDGAYVLRAGERRLRAVTELAEASLEIYCDGKLIPLGSIAATRTSDMDEIALKELEFDENLKRENLTFQEEARAIAEIMKLRRARDPDVTRIEVAREISEATNVPVSTVRENIAHAELVADHLDDPKVAGARSLREAYSIVSRKIQAEFEGALRTQVGSVTTDHEIFNDDLTKLLPTFAEPIYDCILADPPYGMGADEFGSAGPEHAYADDAESMFAVVRCIAREGYRLCKPEAHLYLFCDIDFFPAIKAIVTGAGWKPFRTPLIWDKGGGAGHNPIPAQAIRRSYECILVAVKGDRPALKMIRDVIDNIPNVRDSSHAAEKPAALYSHLLARSCKAGDRVLDPCCGVGPIFEASNTLQLRATGIELDAGYFAIASNRRYKETSHERPGTPESKPADDL